jgi:hypothetical protein
LNEHIYRDLFRLGTNYSRQWMSSNAAPVELLFLQFLSYYVRTFDSKHYLVSIQTRMPVVKSDRNWHSNKLLVEGKTAHGRCDRACTSPSLDPIDIKRSLCQTMQSHRSINYFRDVLHTALNYFGREQNRAGRVHDVDGTVSGEQLPADSLHNSYELFVKRLPVHIFRDATVRQGRIRDFYKQTFEHPLPEPKLDLRNVNEPSCLSDDDGLDGHVLDEEFDELKIDQSTDT